MPQRYTVCGYSERGFRGMEACSLIITLQDKKKVKLTILAFKFDCCCAICAPTSFSGLDIRQTLTKKNCLEKGIVKIGSKIEKEGERDKREKKQIDSDREKKRQG